MEQERFTVKELPVSERPYEKCERYGAASLSDAELLAVIIRTGTKEEHSVDLAKRVLRHSPIHQGIIGIYHHTMEELTRIKGIGKVKAIQLLCVAELSKRLSKANMADSMMFDRPATIADYLMEEMRHEQREKVMLLMFDTKGRLLKEKVISIGTINTSMLSPREIFLEAVRGEAVSIVLIHNHPSGDPTPSGEDVAITKRIREAGNFINIPLIDHIIIGDNRYVSFKEGGLL